MRGKASKADVVVGVCYRSPSQDESTNNFMGFTWSYSFKPIKVLKHIEYYFLIKVLRELTRKGALLDLLFVNRDGLAGKKKRVYNLWKKGQATQEDYKDIMRLCREKIRRAKAQLERNLATAVKDNKKCFWKYVNSKRRAKENLHPFLDAVGETS
ncbi:hypothetical protein QYF61_005413 [Mycteria americana]|uniref:Uncharacterized protein n=1 Tax=Mycteria americana TaxID=33587 RepID=A0AAN7MXN2_MYCAM|nr:hypothetical protein QYF61_005413 [Mycteria americana]